MKIHILSLFLILNTADAFGIVALPPANGTNNLAALRASQQLREIAKGSYAAGEITELERRLGMVEVEALFQAVALGASIACLILLLRGNRAPKTNCVQKNPAKEFPDNL